MALTVPTGSSASTAAPNTATAGTAGARRSLISPWVDFWLLGGASILFCLVFGGAVRIWGNPDLAAADLATAYELGFAGFVLSFFVNYPHFIASYRLAYGRERSFRAKHRFALVQVPIVLTLVALVGVVLVASSKQIGRVDGTATLGVLALLMFVTVGWHYVKQIYGCVRVCASFDGYDMSPLQMKVVRYGLFPLWLRTLVVVGDVSQNLGGLEWEWLSAPQWLRTAVNISVALGALAIAGSFVHHWSRTAQRPSLRMLVPMLAIYVWWVPAVRLGLVLPLIPFFHSLQYVPFIVKVERTRAAEQAGVPSVRAHLARWAGSLFAIGAGVFFVIPILIDAAIGSRGRVGYFAVVMAVTLVINVHHYFIDHVIWRMRDDAHMRGLLMS